MAGARIRLRSVRFKDGRGEIRLLPHKKTDSDRLHEVFDRFVPGMLRGMGGDAAGFAIVTWDAKGLSACMLQSDGKIPSILVPDFVRNRLLASKIEDWTIDTVNEG